MGLTLRTVQRWEKNGLQDRRKGTRVTPVNKLSEIEEKRILKVLSSPEYCDLSPNQIVPLLADKGIYYCSESTIYRLLRKLRMNAHRQHCRPRRHKKPEEYVATGPNQVWSWDITYLPLQVRGRFLYLYMMMDIYSRKVVAWQVHDCESDELAADLITEACFLERIEKNQIVLHSDNGSPMKGATMLAKLQELGVTPSFSRPSVSDDNPYSESLFHTLK
ncbi:integrase catalytic core [Desulfoluna spongiiphila]|nr:integrase catalytic core [Desulfoluna spongiiphila]